MWRWLWRLRVGKRRNWMVGRRRLRRSLDGCIQGRSEVLGALRGIRRRCWCLGTYLGLGNCIWIRAMVRILDGNKIRLSKVRNGNKIHVTPDPEAIEDKDVTVGMTE